MFRTITSPLVIIGGPLAAAVLLALAFRYAVEVYSVPSTSMSPTLQPGDHIVVTPYRGCMPQRGDVIVFRAAGGGEFLVKRVIALPGDLVDSREGRLRIGGHAIAEPYVAAQAASGSIAPQLIPARSVFVLGDSRTDSIDSRHFGPVALDQVAGRARLILWSGRTAVSPPAAGAASGVTGDSVEGGRFRIFKVVR